MSAGRHARPAAARALWLLPTALHVLGGCRPNPNPPEPTFAAAEIASPPRWRDVTDEPWPARSVGLLTLPNGHKSPCTGWHAGGGVVVTANHCARTADEALNAVISFDVVEDASSAAPAPSPCTWHGAQPSSTDDLALLDCQIPAETPCLKLHTPSMSPGLNQRIYIIHQTCDHASLGYDCVPTKKLSWGIFTAWLNDSFNVGLIAHNAYTDAGSSGAPVLLQQEGYPVQAVHLEGSSPGSGRAVDVEPLRPLLPGCTANP